LFFAPPIRWSRFEWNRGSLTMVPADSLAAGRTYTVVVGRNAKDRHGNAAAHARTIAFTTGDTLPQGQLSGRVGPMGAGDAARIFALLAPADENAVPVLRDGDFISAAESDSGGTFTLAHLPADANVRVVAYIDRDASGSFTPETGDPWGYAARVARPAAGVGGLNVVLMN